MYRKKSPSNRIQDKHQHKAKLRFRRHKPSNQEEEERYNKPAFFKKKRVIYLTFHGPLPNIAPSFNIFPGMLGNKFRPDLLNDVGRWWGIVCVCAWPPAHGTPGPWGAPRRRGPRRPSRAHVTAPLLRPWHPQLQPALLNNL